MIRYLSALAAAGAILFLGGCQTAPSPLLRNDPPGSTKKTVDPATRDNCLALLDDLLNDEKNISKLLIIKRNTTELKNLAVSISKTSAEGAKLLKQIGKQEPGLNLKETLLPAGEAATRKAIAKTKESKLLHTNDDELEFQLLLTQAEALNYGAHLAKVAAENDPHPNQARELSSLSSQLAQLYEQVLAMLRHRQ